eukprot:25805-Prymnesium_polylepis.1
MRMVAVWLLVQQVATAAAAVSPWCSGSNDTILEPNTAVDRATRVDPQSLYATVRKKKRMLGLREI